MRIHLFDAVVLAALGWFLVGAPSASANAGPPLSRMAFEFFDESSQPITPEVLQLAGCQDPACTSPTLLYETPRMLGVSICTLPGCLPSTPDMEVFRFSCTQGNACRADAPRFGKQPYYQLIILPRSETPLQQAAVGIFESRQMDFGEIRGLRVVVTPSGLLITDDRDIGSRTPMAANYSSCNGGPTNATIGFVVTQLAEIGAVLLSLLILRVPRKLIGGVLVTIGLINFATYPVVWFTFPALGPFHTAHEQATAVFTLLAALLYAGLIVRLRPAFNPARRGMLVGLVAVALPLVSGLIFGAASVASAAVEMIGSGSKEMISAAGLPYLVTMPASEVFAFTAEAVLIALICRPVVSGRQAVALSVLANSTSLLLGLVLL